MARQLDQIAKWDALAYAATFRAERLTVLCGTTQHQWQHYFSARFGMPPKLMPNLLACLRDWCLSSHWLAKIS